MQGHLKGHDVDNSFDMDDDEDASVGHRAVTEQHVEEEEVEEDQDELLSDPEDSHDMTPSQDAASHVVPTNVSLHGATVPSSDLGIDIHDKRALDNSFDDEEQTMHHAVAMHSGDANRHEPVATRNVEDAHHVSDVLHANPTTHTDYDEELESEDDEHDAAIQQPTPHDTVHDHTKQAAYDDGEDISDSEGEQFAETATTTTNAPPVSDTKALNESPRTSTLPPVATSRLAPLASKINYQDTHHDDEDLDEVERLMQGHLKGHDVDNSFDMDDDEDASVGHRAVTEQHVEEEEVEEDQDELLSDPEDSHDMTPSQDAASHVVPTNVSLHGATVPSSDLGIDIHDKRALDNSFDDEEQTMHHAVAMHSGDANRHEPVATRNVEDAHHVSDVLHANPTTHTDYDEELESEDDEHDAAIQQPTPHDTVHDHTKQAAYDDGEDISD
ncbi:hypothetical protein THRCLA_05748, partial [Thraustotheca clavata]